MLLFSELTNLLASFGPIIERVLLALRSGSVQPSDLEKFLESVETDAANAEIKVEFPHGGEP